MNDMNEKIKQLAERADAYAHLTGEGMMYQKTRERYTEKFAELIVKETLQVARAGIEYGPSMEDAVYKYFGVKD